MTDSHVQQKFEELEARERAAREDLEWSLQRENHLHGLIESQVEELNQLRDALWQAREDAAEMKVTIATLERKVLDDVHDCWAPKKKTSALVRRPKSLRQPKLPTRQSMRLLERRQMDSDCYIQESPASPSPYQQ